MYVRMYSYTYYDMFCVDFSYLFSDINYMLYVYMIFHVHKLCIIIHKHLYIHGMKTGTGREIGTGFTSRLSPALFTPRPHKRFFYAYCRSILVYTLLYIYVLTNVVFLHIYIHIIVLY